MQSPANTVSEAYERGTLEENGPAIGVFVFGDPGSPYAPTNMRPVEIREAVDSWTAAQFDHGHTSYYGAAHVRQMRAYWLGRLRAARA